MPFVLTCDSCHAKLRTATAPATGRKVACPKCGTAFAVSAKNCQEVPAPKPAAPAWEVVEETPPTSEGKSRSAPARNRAEVAEDDERPAARSKPPARASRRDEDDEDERPRRKRRPEKGGSGRKLAVWIGAGAALLLLVGGGVYLATRGGAGGGGGDAEGGGQAAGSSLVTRPKRELPKDVFAYWPSPQHSAQLHDFAAGGKPFIAEEARALGLTPEQVAYSLFCPELVGDTVRVYATKAAFDLEKGAEAAKWKPLTVAGGTAYEHPTRRGVSAFQPKPNIVVLTEKLGATAPNTKLIEELLPRTFADAKIPEGLWDLMQEVSGYELVSGKVAKSGDELVSVTAKFRVDDTATTDTHTETLTCWEYASNAQAKQAETGFKAVSAKLGGGRSNREVSYEVVGPRLYRLIRAEKNKPK